MAIILHADYANHIEWRQASVLASVAQVAREEEWMVSVTLGNTKYPDKTGCPTTAFHSHQETCRFPGTHALSAVRNTTLATNTAYLQNDLNRYIHKWDWNSVPPSTPTSYC
jgi:hypothetical protein